MIIITIYSLIALVCCGFAWIKGGPAEKYGAAVYGGGWILVTAYQFLTGEGRPVIPILTLDLAVAVGFLILAVRYNSLWLGVAMILQGIEFGMHTLYLNGDGTEQPHLFGWNAYGLGMNLISLALLFAMVGAACASMGRRKRAKTQADDDLWEAFEA